MGMGVSSLRSGVSPEQGLSVLHQTGNSPRGGAVSPWAAAVSFHQIMHSASVDVDGVDVVPHSSD